MDFESELRAAAKRDEEGWSAVRARRSRWRETVDQVLLPTLQRACAVLGEGGLEAKSRAFDDRANASDVELWLAPFPTDLHWKDREGKPVDGVERPAAMGYGQGDDGRIAHWRIGHSLEGDPPPAPRVIATFTDPAELTQELVEKHVVEFLRGALGTSIRGEPMPSDRPIGFVVPTVPDAAEK
jgi:hypothetical protein